MLKIEDIAQICHQANRAYCQVLGDDSQPDWYHAPEWMKQNAIKGVEFRLANLNALPSAQHEAWLRDKEKEGWKYGAIKNSETREHPCMLPYDDLPEEQKAKDALFMNVVYALRHLGCAVAA